MQTLEDSRQVCREDFGMRSIMRYTKLSDSDSFEQCKATLDFITLLLSSPLRLPQVNSQSKRGRDHLQVPISLPLYQSKPRTADNFLILVACSWTTTLEDLAARSIDTTNRVLVYCRNKAKTGFRFKSK